MGFQYFTGEKDEAVFNQQRANKFTQARVGTTGSTRFVSGASPQIVGPLQVGTLYKIVSEEPAHFLASSSIETSASVSHQYWPAKKPIFHIPRSGSSEFISIYNHDGSDVSAWVKVEEDKQDVVWNPSQIQSLTMWFDSTYGVQISGGTVEIWKDKSGNGNNLAQSFSPGRRPIYNSLDSDGNGYPSIEFSGSHLMTASHHSSQQLSETGGTFYFVVYRRYNTSVGGPQGRFNKWESPFSYLIRDQGEFDGRILIRSSSNSSNIILSSGSAFENNSLQILKYYFSPFDIDNILGLRKDFDTSLEITFDESALSGGDSPITIGAHGGNDNFGYDKFFEIIFCQENISDQSELDKIIMNYFNTKYNVF